MAPVEIVCVGEELVLVAVAPRVVVLRSSMCVLLTSEKS